MSLTPEQLVDFGLLTPAQLEICAAQQRQQLQASGRPNTLVELAIRNRFVSRAQAADLATDRPASGDHTALLSTDICLRYQVVPVRVEAGILVVRAARRLSTHVQDALIAACTEPVAAIKVQAVDVPNLKTELETLTADDHSFTALVHKLRTEATGQSLRLAIDTLLGDALRSRASDIHIDRRGDLDSWISYRIDGVLVQKYLLPERTVAALLTRIKTDAGLDASNLIKPQDGRISLTYRGRNIDFRLATQPLVSGHETVTLRVLDAETLPEIEQMFPDQLDMSELFRGLANANGKKGGIVLVAGATGSGKTTTLYALAKMLPRDRVNLMTVEDPVEYALPFARQIQLNQLLGQDAGDFERSLLRQDPDVILLGEIRDEKSARAAIKFAESGHMVLATLHADGALDVFERLAGFFSTAAEKAEALYLLAQQLRVVMHQQLVPALCSCAIPLDFDTSRALAEPLGLDLACSARHRIGCPACSRTGQKGRVLAHETLAIPRDTGVRLAVHELLRDGLAGLQGLGNIPGVTYQRRNDTVTRLLEAGKLDFDEARKVLS